MPVLATFYGITIRMYFRDHAPPHFHAMYAEHEGLIRISDGVVLRGALPRRAQRLVEEWRTLHEEELRVCWDAAQAAQPLEQIPPLD